MSVAARDGLGTVPVGPVPRTININIDYAPVRWGRWAAALQWTSLSSRVVTNDDQNKLPPLSMLNVSVRYSVRLFNRPCSLTTDARHLMIPAVQSFLPISATPERRQQRRRQPRSGAR